mmetsp:Transcript_29120/g.49148  ORF Transcript_29120/g.49148 Transcript_29120/m.49148 type:complete len:173 (-) Transcript_29120:634-1152(-)
MPVLCIRKTRGDQQQHHSSRALYLLTPNTPRCSPHRRHRVSTGGLPGASYTGNLWRYRPAYMEAAERSTAMGTTATTYKAEMVIAMDPAAFWSFSSWRITTEFCAQGMQASISSTNRSSGSLGIQPSLVPQESSAKPKRGMAKKRAAINAPTLVPSPTWSLSLSPAWAFTAP